MAITGTGIFTTTTSMERYIIGTGALLQNMARELENIRGRISRRGMWQVLLLLKRESIRKTPVLTGNLQSSYSTFVESGMYGVEGYLVNNASYALFVHEMPEFSASGAYTRFRKPGSGPKFVENPLRDNQRRFLDILRNSARIR